MKKDFLKYEVSILSINAALATRDKDYPIYSAQSSKRDAFKQALRDVLWGISDEADYISGTVSSEVHTARIHEVAKALGSKFTNILHEEKFRIGITQKVINLYLKYMWCMGYINEPPHCPIDGIIRDLAGLDYDWTKSDSVTDYEKAVEDLRCVARKDAKSLSQWELDNFQRK